MSVCMYVCLYVSFSFFVIYSKSLQATHTSKFVILCNIFLRMPLWKKKNQKFCVRGSTVLFGHQVQNNFFALIKKIFLQPLVEIIFRYHKEFFLGFWDPLGPPYEQNENFCMWGHGYQNWVKSEIWVHFWKNFWKICKNEGFGHKFLDTQYKIIFALIKKIFLQPLVEIIFRYHKNFF